MIAIFKTNVSDAADERLLKPHLDAYLQDARWTFDLEDCDKVLRVDSPHEMTDGVIALLKDKGYLCEEFLS